MTTLAVGEICEFKYGSSLPERARETGDVPVYGSNGQVGFHSEALTDGPAIIVGRKGSIGQINYSPRPCWPIDTTYFVDQSATKHDLRWLSYALSSLRLGELNKATGVPGLNRNDAYAKLLYVPPPDEQRRIAAILDQADDLRRKRREAYWKSDQLVHAIYKSKFDDPVTNHMGHPSTTVGAMNVEMEYGPRFYNEAYSEDGIRIVRITDLSETGELNFDAMPKLSVSGADLEKHRSRPGELLFARTGATVGKLALISPEDPICIPGAYFIRLRFPPEVDPTFAWYTLRSNSVQGIIFEGSRQSAQQNFSGPGLRRLPFIVPPFALQRSFTAQVAEIGKLKARHRAHLAKLDVLFASLQQRAFRGEL